MSDAARPRTARPRRGEERVLRDIIETPDGRYLCIDGVLWRRTDPALSASEVERLKSELGRARSAVGVAKRKGTDEALREARQRVHAAKVSLGERGPVWWSDGAPDENRRKVENSSYAVWFAELNR